MTLPKRVDPFQDSRSPIPENADGGALFLHELRARVQGERHRTKPLGRWQASHQLVGEHRAVPRAASLQSTLRYQAAPRRRPPRFRNSRSSSTVIIFLNVPRSARAFSKRCQRLNSASAVRTASRLVVAPEYFITFLRSSSGISIVVFMIPIIGNLDSKINPL